MRQRTDQREHAGNRLVSWRLAVCAAVVAAAAIQALTAAGGAAAAAGAGSAAGRSAAVASGGTLRAWGYNYSGQLGNGMQGNQASSPVKVKLPAGTKITSVRAGCDHALALTSTGTVLAWGSNSNGQLGVSSKSHRPTPARVKLPRGTKVKAIRAGCDYSMALTTTGKVLAWGYNGQGQLGNDTTVDSHTPVRVKLPAGVKATAISAGFEHSLALTSTGKVLAWGSNLDGQLGNGTHAARSVPVRVKVPTGTKVTAVAAGSFISLALTSKGQVLAWGDNAYGELGNGTTTPSSRPVRAKLPPGTRVRGIFAGCAHTLALTTAGKVLAWGDNNNGQLGNGTTMSSSVPVRPSMPAGASVTAVSAGCQHSLALTSKGRVLAWGYNFRGQLGNGTTTSSSTPGRVELRAGVAAIAIGNGPNADFSFAIVHARS
jgi:alpha-tubulin suppressor-like RCC1 family protein